MILEFEVMYCAVLSEALITRLLGNAAIHEIFKMYEVMLEPTPKGYGYGFLRGRWLNLIEYMACNTWN